MRIGVIELRGRLQHLGWAGGNRPKRMILILVLIAIALSGCDRSVEEEVGGPVSRTAFERWAVGGMEERGGIVLAAPPSSGAIGPGGLVAVADRAGSTILLLGLEGEPVRELGRRGFAPGEFRQLDKVGFAGDTLLWASDAGSRWITWYDLRRPDSLWTVQAPEEQVPSTHWTAKPSWVLDGGRLLGKPRRGVQSSGSEATPPIPVVAWSSEGELRVVDMVETVAPRSRRIRMANGLFSTTSQVLDGAPIIEVARGGKWFFVLDRTPASADSGLIRIARYDPDGLPIDRLEIPYRAEPMSDTVMGWIRGQAESMEEQLPPEMGIDAEAVLEATWLPERLPPVREVLADEEGFWIQREMTSPGLWERYDLTGNLLFDVRLPRTFRGLAGSPGAVLGWMMDTLYVPELRFLEIIAIDP